MILVLLRDVGDIGSLMGGQMTEQKKPTIENLDQAEEEFTLARLYLSKLKTEARSLTGVCSSPFFSTTNFFLSFSFLAFKRIRIRKSRSSKNCWIER